MVVADEAVGSPPGNAWVLQNVMLKADVVTLDNSLDNAYAQHLLEGKSLPINYSTYVSQLMSIQSSGGVFTANVTRSFTRLKSVFATFLSHSKLAADTGSLTIKDWNYFYHPMASYAPGARYSPNDDGATDPSREQAHARISSENH